MTTDILYSRRNLLKGMTALGGLTVWPGKAFSNNSVSPTTTKRLVVLFLDGGFDGLQAIAPALDTAYQSARPSIKVSATGPNAGIEIGTLDNVPFFMPTQMAPLSDLFDAGQLAVVHATGHKVNDRSHFICRERLELGIDPGWYPSIHRGSTNRSGWLSRLAGELSPDTEQRGFIANHWSPVSIRGLESVPVFGDRYPSLAEPLLGDESVLDAIYSANSGISAEAMALKGGLSGVRALQETLAFQSSMDALSRPYPATDFGSRLSLLASILKQDPSVQFAQVDQLGWDTHAFQQRDMFPLLSELSSGLAAFWEDLGDLQEDTVVVTLTEFGRRIEENGSGGTDHGSATATLVLGNRLNGGQIYGDWPGLNTQAHSNGDLLVTTDYRAILSEIAAAHLSISNTQAIFPDLNHQAEVGLFES